MDWVRNTSVWSCLQPSVTQSIAVLSHSILHGQVRTTFVNGAEQRNARSRSGRLTANPTLNRPGSYSGSSRSK